MTQPKQECLERLTDQVTMWLEPPDVVCIRATGVTNAAEMTAMGEYYERHIRNWPYVIILVDQRQTTSMTPEARKVAAQAYKWVPFRGTALYGSSFAMRTVGQLILKIINTLQKVDNPMSFLKTEEEARAWIEQRRRELNESGPAKKAG